MVDEDLFDGVTEISFSAMFRERMKAMPEETRQARFRNVGDPRRTDRLKSTYEHGVQSPFVVHAVASYEHAFRHLEEALAESGGPWIHGADPTLADINLMPFAARLDYLGLLDLWTGGRRRVQDWWTRRKLGRAFGRGFTISFPKRNSLEMRTHGPKIRDGIAAHLAVLRKNATAGLNAA